jgi:transcriptional regulator GlxA family with amidase domain
LQAGTDVGAVAAGFGVDRRVLAAVFRREVGFGPKRYARLARFERALRELRAPCAPPLATVAARHGYADQAHLTREFGDLAGLPPGRLHRMPGPTALHVLHDETFKTVRCECRRLGA